MLENFYILTDIALLICCLYTYRALDANFKKWLPFITFSVIFGLLNVFNLLIVNKTNAWSNNLEDIIEFGFYTWFIIQLDKRDRYKKKTFIISLAIIGFSLVDIFFIQGFWKRATIAIVTQNLFALALICNYYYNLLNDNNDEYINLVSHAPFLALTGMLFYYLAMTFYYSCFSYMVYRNNYHFYILANTLLDITSLIFNFLLSFAFICSFRKNKLSLS